MKILPPSPPEMNIKKRKLSAITEKSPEKVQKQSKETTNLKKVEQHKITELLQNPKEKTSIPLK